jgi:hypothetical protein
MEGSCRADAAVGLDSCAHGVLPVEYAVAKARNLVGMGGWASTRRVNA